MADTNTTIEGVGEGINVLSLKSKTFYGEAELSLERIEHIDGAISYFALAEDVEGSVHASYSVEQMTVLRDFLIRTLG